jgi:hypothetical protein
MNTQVSILLNQLDLDKRICEGMARSAPKFVSSTLLRICDPDPSIRSSTMSLTTLILCQIVLKSMI